MLFWVTIVPMGIEIISGLKANQSIVVEGKEKLSDNALICL